MGALDKVFLQECLFKEINLIQDIIKRMASNSFLIKGWTVTLVVASLLLRGSKYQVLISLIPLIVFWFLDSYFLQRERMYRKLYDWVTTNRPITDERLFDLNAKRFEKKVGSIGRTMFSITLGWFYGMIFILIVAYSIFVFLYKGGCLNG